LIGGREWTFHDHNRNGSNDCLKQKLDQLRLGLAVVDPALDSADISRQIAWFKRQKMVEPDIDAEKIIDKSFVPDRPTAPK